ncbi:MAK10-like protein [Tanacetum coccineum]
MERFVNAIFRQREGINSRMTEMFRLLKELTTKRTPEKVMIREEAKFPVTKNVNSISLTKGEEEMSNNKEVTPDNTKRPTKTETKMPVKKAETKNGAKNGTGNKSIKTHENEEAGPVYDAILKKKITKKEDIRGNFEIPCNIGGQKGINALVDQGSDMNVMPYTTYMKLTNERPAETDMRLSLASHLYIYPLGIAEDMLVEVAEHVYSIDFVILDINENEKRPFILGTPFLTTAMATIRFYKGTITLRSGKSKVSFHTANAVIDCRMAKIAIGEGITRSVSVVKGVDLGEEEAPYWTTLGKRESYKPRPSSDGIVAKPSYYARKTSIDCHFREREWEFLEMRA